MPSIAGDADEKLLSFFDTPHEASSAQDPLTLLVLSRTSEGRSLPIREPLLGGQAKRHCKRHTPHRVGPQVVASPVYKFRPRAAVSDNRRGAVTGVREPQPLELPRSPSASRLQVNKNEGRAARLIRDGCHYASRSKPRGDTTNLTANGALYSTGSATRVVPAAAAPRLAGSLSHLDMSISVQQEPAPFPRRAEAAAARPSRGRVRRASACGHAMDTSTWTGTMLSTISTTTEPWQARAAGFSGGDEAEPPGSAVVGWPINAGEVPTTEMKAHLDDAIQRLYCSGSATARTGHNQVEGPPPRGLSSRASPEHRRQQAQARRAAAARVAAQRDL